MRLNRSLPLLFLVGVLFLTCLSAKAEDVSSTGNVAEAYHALHKFQLSGQTAVAENLVLKRDRVEMTFSGTFYFEEPAIGKTRGAVFLGQGTFHAPAPPSEFELDNLRRMLKADKVNSEFHSAVLRFTDDTADLVPPNSLRQGEVPREARKLAEEFEPRFLKETGANLAARVAVSVLNRESPGFFLGEFEGGKRGRFTFLFDSQSRIPVAHFGINAGEKGIIFAHRNVGGGTDVWMAFYSLEDYQRGRVNYSDAYDLVSIPHYAIEIDVTNPKKVMRTEVHMDLESLVNGLNAFPLVVGESLPEYDSIRLKKELRLKAARFADGSTLEAIQEEWEGGLTVFLPAPRAAGEKFSMILELAGDFMYDSPFLSECTYPRETSEWYPRHGYLRRSTFDLTFRHRKRDKAVSAGLRVRYEPSPDNDKEMISEWKVDTPVALTTFGVGPFEPHTEMVDLKGNKIPITFYSLPGYLLAIKEDFVVAELMNSLRYFSALFGDYPYGSFGAMYHPRAFGQGFATMLLLPRSDNATKYTFSFISHETAHQWWGDVVGWRSYRDQWLSEGFVEYSGVLYTARRERPKDAEELVHSMRESLRQPPETQLGIASGRVVDVGPLILGRRLATRETENAYQTLIYNKGALVLRMLHFLFADPQTGDPQPFYDMMSDFVARHRNGWATTESFIEVANNHFTSTPVAQRYKMKDLNWFFRQWVYETYLPSYRLEYDLENAADGSVLLKGIVYQENAGEKWFMPLPLVLRYEKDQQARGLVYAYGPSTPIQIKIPGRPKEVDLDPQHWVLSEKTSVKRLK